MIYMQNEYLCVCLGGVLNPTVIKNIGRVCDENEVIVLTINLINVDSRCM